MQKKIFFFVFFAHLIALVIITREKSYIPSIQKPISIRTTIVKAPSKKKVMVAKKKEKKIVKKKTTRPAPKKIAKRKTNKPAAKKSKSHPIYKDLKEKLAKIQIEEDNDNLFVPKAISFDTKDLSRVNDQYKEELGNFFSKNLTLPDKGKVQVLLKISSDGKLIECKMLEAESKENQEYLKNQLHQLNFPCFNGGIKSIVICFSDV